MYSRNFPKKLTTGAHIRVVAPSRSIGGLRKYNGITDQTIQFAIERFQRLGIKVSFGKNVEECDRYLSAPVRSRINDIHEAFEDSHVDAILAASGGSYASQLLRALDYDLLRRNPKIFCGYSDFAYLANAIFTKTGLVTYYGPSFLSFAMEKGFEYTQAAFERCLFARQTSEALRVSPSTEWSEDSWALNQQDRHFHPNPGPFVINEGLADGTIIGGGWINFLLGTEFQPALEDSILFLEAPWAEGKGTHSTLDLHLNSLVYQPTFKHVRGIVLGRFLSAASLDRTLLIETFKSRSELRHIPIVAGVDFGHTSPMITFPIGGWCRLSANNERAEVEIVEY